jgi:hypothetical protein
VKSILLLMAALIALAGCESNPKKTDYEAWASAVSDRAKYRAMERSAGVQALEEAVKSADPTTSLAAAISLGIVSAVQASARQADQDRELAPPKDWSDKIATVLSPVAPMVIGGLNAWAAVTTVKEGGKTNRYLADQATAQQSIQSRERVDTIGKIVDGNTRTVEAATKNPTNVTTITASGSATVAANGSTASRTEEANSIECTATQTARAGDSQGSETAAAGGAGGGAPGSNGGTGGNVTGGARSAPAAGTQTQNCTTASGKK